MISVKQLNFMYPDSKKQAIKNISFDVDDGEILGFLGPSGAGKSTTQKILIGLLQGFDGEITILGKKLQDWKNDFYERIGVSFELPNHFLKLTALENLTYFSKLYSGHSMPAKDALKLVNLEHDGELLVGQYSKGMKNRLGVARALMHNPALLFLDEPTSGLDPVNARLVRDLIREQKRNGKTVFLTTHDMVTADELCDRVAFIVDGKINQIDAPRALRIKYGKPIVRIEFSQNGNIRQREFPLTELAHNETFTQIINSGTVQTIHSQEATLEDVFVAATGRRLI